MTKYRKLAVALICSSLVIAACGGDDDESTATTAAAGGTETTAAAGGTETTAAAGGTETTAAAGEDPGVAAAKANVEANLDPNASIGVTIPLTGVPEKKTIAWMECDVPTCAAYITPGFEAATAALGWDLVKIPMKSTEPGPAFQQAIDQGVDFIASTGLAIAQYQPQLEAANAAGIKVLSCFGTDDPSPDTIQMQCGDENFVSKTGPLMADWAIADSNGAANILIVSIPDFPVLKVETDAFIAQLGTNCAACTYEELEEERAASALPTVIVDNAEFAQDLIDNSGGDWFVAAWADQFKALWGV